MRTRIIIILLIIVSLLLAACPRGETARDDKGENIKMKTYMIGRFAVDVPEDMKPETRDIEIRMNKIEEEMVPVHRGHDEWMENIWNKRLNEVKSYPPPDGMKSSLVETGDFPDAGRKARSILHYGTFNSLGYRIAMDVLLDAGSVAVWLKTRTSNDGKNIKLMTDNVKTVAKAYKPVYPAPSTQGDWFYSVYGALNLPYKWQESYEIRFLDDKEDGLDLTIYMKDTHKVQEKGFIESIAATLAMKLAPGLDVEYIRRGNRTVGGLTGEELVAKGTDKYNTTIRYGWVYPGEARSGERPRIVFDMESPDGNVEEKLKIWDAILNSFHPTYKTTK